MSLEKQFDPRGPVASGRGSVPVRNLIATFVIPSVSAHGIVALKRNQGGGGCPWVGEL